MDIDNFYQILSDNKNNYTLIKNILSEKDLKECLDIAYNLDKTDDENYDTFMFDPKEVFSEDHFFYNLNITKISEIYGFDNVDEVQFEIARDYPNFCNKFHTDVHENKNTVTLQWYLNMDDPSRKLHIGTKRGFPFKLWEEEPTITELDTCPNSMVSFLAQPNTYHGFKNGTGYRYNLRIRLIEYLKKDSVIHRYNKDSKVCWFIDAKDMEVESYPVDNHVFNIPENGCVEDFLSRLTYDFLLSHNQSNIIVNDKIRNYPETLQYLQDQGFEKCVIVMAGACITEQTIDYIYNNTNEFSAYGQLNDNKDSFLRKVTVLNLNNLDITKADGHKKYLSEYINSCKEFNIKQDLNCYYVHPEHNTFRALFDITRYCSENFLDKLDEEYPELKSKDRDTLKKITKYYISNVIEKLPHVKVKEYK